MMMQSRRLRSRSPGELRTFQSSLLRLLNDHVGPGLVGRVVQQTTNVMHKQRIQQIRDLFLVGKFQGALKGDPHALQVHRTNLDHMTDLFTLQDTVTTTASHTSDIEQLGTVDHMVI